MCVLCVCLFVVCVDLSFGFLVQIAHAALSGQIEPGVFAAASAGLHVQEMPFFFPTGAHIYVYI